MPKLLVFFIDALCAGDLAAMRDLPNFGPYLEKAAIVQELEPVWPAVTYPCHTSILTGCTVGRHGIYSNEIITRGAKTGGAWHQMKDDVKVPTLLDHAREAGLSTCSLSWPVSGGADYDFNMPMIVPYNYTGWEPEAWLEGTASKELLDKYWWKHGRYIKGPDRSLDLFTMALALDFLEDFEQPDVMLVKMCDLDSARHRHGVYTQEVSDQLRKHDEEFGALLEALRQKPGQNPNESALDETNIVIVGDHGQTDIEDVLLLNVLLRQNGFLELDEEGEVLHFDAFCHSTGLGAYIEVNPQASEARRYEIRTFLESLKEDESIQLAYVLDEAEAKETFGIYGPFDFILESALPISFGDDPRGDAIWGSKVPGDKKLGAATHGGSPTRAEVTTFTIAGPSAREGAELARESMLHVAPTLAATLGLSMPEADGHVLEALLK